ncbi:MAG: GH92 family glycosyl hydrolase [Bacteroidales bacterium]
MFNKSIIVGITAILAIPLLIFSQNSINPASYVNPFIGTGGHGHTYPGAQMPFGMVQLSPDTRLEGWDGCSAYHYSDSIIYGFSHTHLSGTGCSDYGDILLMPVTEIKWKNKDYASTFHHNKEKAEAGYYSVFLEKYNIKTELTATKRAGFHQYIYPAGVKPSIILDLWHRDEVLESAIEITGNNEIAGMRKSKAWADQQVVYFVAEFSKPFVSSGIAENDQLLDKKTSAKGKNLKAFVSFSEGNIDTILVKVGLSAVSIEGARKNLKAEIPGWDFSEVKAMAYQAWNKEMGKIQIEGKNEEDKIKFYSALYHSMLAPNLYCDVDGNYLGRDFKVHKTNNFDYYTVFSLWDTYRANHPLFTLIDEKRTNDFINTFIRQYEEGGLLPVWELSSNETFCMIGYHAVPVIADAFMKGIKDYDADKALEAMKFSANTDKYGLPHYRKFGFVPGDKENESVSKTLEYAYDDWCISQMARALGDKEGYATFCKRAQSYKNIFDPSTHFMRPRINGGWYKPFDPTEVNNHFTEANAWQYSFYVPHDVDGFTKLLGGKHRLGLRLDEMFNASSQMAGRNQADITGMIGQYAHGNEPSHHMAYLYNYAGQSWKTQKIVRQIMTDLYKNAPDGLSGNEDCGQMSAWYVLSAMGFYPVCPGQTQYAIGSPVFDKITLNQENGKIFTITVNNLSPENFYIVSAKWNGMNYNRSFISHQMIRQGGTLEFEMGPSPNIQWGSTDYDIPRTFINNNLIVPVPYIEADSRTFTDSLQITMGNVDPSVAIYYTLDGTEPGNTSNKYSEPFIIRDKITIKALAFNKKGEYSQTAEANYTKIPGGRKITLNTSFENQYTAGGPNGLIDGIRGTSNWRLGNWMGYLDTDMDAVVDLGNIQQVRKVSIGFLQDIGAWIWFPTEIIVSVSADGLTYQQLASMKPDVADNDYTCQIKDFTAKINEKTRFIKVQAKKYGTIPSWHLGAGDKSHLFVDEIVIE